MIKFPFIKLTPTSPYTLRKTNSTKVFPFSIKPSLISSFIECPLGIIKSILHMQWSQCVLVFWDGSSSKNLRTVPSIVPHYLLIVNVGFVKFLKPIEGRLCHSLTHSLNHIKWAELLPICLSPLIGFLILVLQEEKLERDLLGVSREWSPTNLAGQLLFTIETIVTAHCEISETL